MLSTAKISPGEGSCLIPDHTIIFVAFDSEEPGSFGSIQVLVFKTSDTVGIKLVGLKWGRRRNWEWLWGV